MRYLALGYHDVSPDGKKSGFPGGAAATYKLSLGRFQEHLGAIAGSGERVRFQLLFTFDDGGAGACYAAEALEQVGYRGHFFITSSLIGLPAFITAAQVAELHSRGHIIGSHGATHRGKMSRMPAEALTREWRDSVQTLSAIIGSPVYCASVPSGFYTPRVARAAAGEGIRQLFTQQPTTQAVEVSGCEVIGRFTMRSWTSASRVQALIRGAWWPRFEDAALWRLREVAKSVGGSAYGDLRRAFLERRSSAEVG
jgi:peptidoglycan/xylan/chitin deacetylase (PgdA/CDA1 family)